MQRYFQTGATKKYEFRKQQLLKLKNIVEAYEQEIFDAYRVVKNVLFEK